MLEIKIFVSERWNEIKQEFIPPNEYTLRLEHSLVSLSKWESKWHKPFLTNKEKTVEETIDYIRCMTISQNIDPDIYNYLSKNNIETIEKYIEDSMTATTFSDTGNKAGGGEQITAELVYYWMIALNIPFECQKWHLSRLLTLIKVCSIKNSPPKKMGRNELMRRNAAMNAARRKQMGTKG